MGPPTTALEEDELPSSTWEDLARRYAEFAALPAWWAAGDFKPITPDKSRTEAALNSTINKLRSRFRHRWPSSPLQFNQEHVRLLFPGADLQAQIRNPRRSTTAGQLWNALLLDRCDFACCWCGRSAFDTFEHEQRTLRLELDHQTPRASGGATLSLENVLAACRSCNTLRGRLVPERMRLELLSIARSILKVEGPPPR
jgi:5-methylcytosine-specific restriction endonuclease McrA